MIVTGKGGSGSWAVRGEQLGNALNAAIIPRAQNVHGHDVLLIKKDNGCNLNGANTLIWDVIDYWPQPEGNTWSKKQHIQHVLQQACRLHVDHMIAATRQMAEDLNTPFYLYHHGRTYTSYNVIREKVRKVGYEGSYKFLGRWARIVQDECDKRGWEFVINPSDLRDVDMLVALRDFPYKGYATEHWKSNVKLANAQNSGTPIILHRECGYKETESGGECWADTPEEVVKAMEELEAQSIRLWKAAKLRTKQYLVGDAARDFRSMRLC